MIERPHAEDGTDGSTVRTVGEYVPTCETRSGAKDNERIKTLATKELVKSFPARAMEHALERHAGNGGVAAMVQYRGRCAKSLNLQREIVREAMPPAHRHLGRAAQGIAVAGEQRTARRAYIPACTVGISLCERIFRAKSMAAGKQNRQCKKSLHDAPAACSAITSSPQA